MVWFVGKKESGESAAERRYPTCSSGFRGRFLEVFGRSAREVSAGRRSAVAGPGKPFGVAPEHLKVIVSPGVGLEDVDHDIDAIGEHPDGSVVDRGAERGEPTLGAERLNIIKRGPHLPVRGARGDEDEVGDLRDLADVQQDDIGALVVVEEARGFDGEGVGFRLAIGRPVGVGLVRLAGIECIVGGVGVVGLVLGGACRHLVRGYGLQRRGAMVGFVKGGFVKRE